ncbi:MAG: PAS domain S-box protein [Pseudomonadales bacterium]|jgi:methyl-accepting chemotaxis protein
MDRTVEADSDLLRDLQAQLDAIGKSQAVIEFDMDGTIRDANENFCATLGYALDEIKGQHHRMFVEPGYAKSAEYWAFWERLNRGEYVADEFKRIGKGGKEVWIQASYNPILDLNGKPFKVVKYATDISEQKDAEFQIQRLIDLAAKGELDERLDASSYGGSMANLANSFSTMVEAFVGPMRDVSKVVTALAEGDLSTRMAEDYEGEFAVLRDAANGCSENLFDMV